MKKQYYILQCIFLVMPFITFYLYTKKYGETVEWFLQLPFLLIGIVMMIVVYHIVVFRGLGLAIKYKNKRDIIINSIFLLPAILWVLGVVFVNLR